MFLKYSMKIAKKDQYMYVHAVSKCDADVQYIILKTLR